MITFSPKASSPLVLAKLKDEDGAREFEKLVIASVLDNPDLLTAALPIINYDEQEKDHIHTDFLDPTLGFLYEGIFNFRRTWYGSTPYPKDRADWATAVVPWLKLLLEATPDLPSVYLEKALMALFELPPARVGVQDQVIDGLIDFIYFVRFHRAQNKAKRSEPVDRKKAFEDVPLSIHEPGSGVLLPTVKELLAKGMEPAGSLTFRTGFGAFDRFFAGRCVPGDAWLFFGGSGAGKSIIAAATAGYSAAFANRTVLLISTEMQAVKMVQRMTSAVLSRSYKEISAMLDVANPQASYPPDVNDFLELIDQKVFIQHYDEVVGSSYDEKMKRMLSAFQQRHGNRPDIVILDWLGSAIDQSFENSWQKSEGYNQIARYMAKLADNQKCLTISFAQTKVTSASKSCLNTSDVKDCTGLDQYMEGVCGITCLPNRDAAQVSSADEMYLQYQFWCISKCREHGTRRLRVRRDFDKCRFRDV